MKGHGVTPPSHHSCMGWRQRSRGPDVSDIEAPVRYSVVDVETTGLRTGDRVVEVAVVSADARGRVTGVFESLVNPGSHPGPIRLHGIDPGECQQAPVFLELAHALYGLLVGTVLVGHNLRFDWGHLRHEFGRCGVTFLSEPAGLCTAEACRRAGLPARLDAACDVLGLAYRSRHRARADAEATRQLWSALRSERAFPSSGQPLRAGVGWHRLPASSSARPRCRPPRRQPAPTGEETSTAADRGFTRENQR